MKRRYVVQAFFICLHLQGNRRVYGRNNVLVLTAFLVIVRDESSRALPLNLSVKRVEGLQFNVLLVKNTPILIKHTVLSINFRCKFFNTLNVSWYNSFLSRACSTEP